MPTDGLTPRIEQHRLIGGVDTVVAVWSSLGSGPNCQEIFRTTNQGPYSPAQLQQMAATGCGPFGNTTHVDLFRMWLPGDTFLVFPAVYTGTNNNITLHAQTDYWDGAVDPTFAPNDITIQGVTQNGIRPVIYRNDAGGGDSETGKDAVEIQNGYGDTIDNIDVQLGPSGVVLQSLVYLIGAGTAYFDASGNALTTPIIGGTTTLSRMHVSYAELMESISGGANGIFGDTTGGGLLSLRKLEIDHNGGSGPQWSGGPGHGIYIGGSTVDPAYAVSLMGSYFHDNYYGHDAKLRPVTQTVLSNYFKGGLPQGGIYTQAEAFNLDIPNGGVLDAEDNVMVKNNSGANSATFGIAYGEEGVPDARALSITIRNNTFVTFSNSISGGPGITYPMVPLEFFYPPQTPGSPNFPVAASNTNIVNNAFVGYCPTGNAPSDYRGTTALIAGFGDIAQTFSLGDQWVSAAQTIVGTPAYRHLARETARTNAAIGAQN